jgi:hypothetical protein
MALAALVISIVAALGTAAAAIYARQQVHAARGQVKAAEETLAIERARRVDQQRPGFDATITPVNQGGWYRMDLTLSTQWPLTRMDVTIVEGDGVRFGRGQTGVRPADVNDPMKSAEWGALRPGEAVRWKVDLDAERSDSIRLEIICHGEHGEQWLVSVRVDVPYDVTQSVF